MRQELNNNRYEEEWLVILQSKGQYTLSKMQALALKQAISQGQKRVMFESFYIPIPYIVEFYRVRKFLKDTYKLPTRASEKPYQPMSNKKWEIFKKEAYKKIGKSL